MPPLMATQALLIMTSRQEAIVDEMPQVVKKTRRQFGLSLLPDEEVAFCKRECAMAGGPRCRELSCLDPAMTDQMVHRGG